MPGRDRERRLARERYQRNLARRARTKRRARKRNLVIGVAAGATLLAGGMAVLLAVTAGWVQ